MSGPARTASSFRVVEGELQALLQQLLDEGGLTVGRVVELAGRRYRVTGFDPVSVRPRGVYVRELETRSEGVVELPGGG